MLSEFGLLTQPVALERVRYALEARAEIENFKWMADERSILPEVTGDPRPGPAWAEAIGQLASARVKTLDSMGVFVRRPGQYSIRSSSSSCYGTTAPADARWC